jgi:hypothetical protein
MISYSDIRLHKIIFENWKFSPSLYAEKADMYMCHIEKASKIQQIHQIRPDLICLIYRNIRAVYQRTPDELQMFRDNGWILKDANGTEITSDVFGYYIVDVGNPDYQTWVANWTKTNLDKYGADGVFLDNCLPSTEIMWSTSPGPPINPRTGEPYTSEEFRDAVISLVNKVKDVIGSKLVIGNGIFDGSRFFSDYRHQYYVDLLLKSKIDGIESEGWLSSIDSAEWYSEDKWLNSIKFVVWLENNFLKEGKMFLPVCQNAEPYNEQGPTLPENCTKEQYALYCFCSLLLAVKSNSHYMNFGYYISDYVDSLFDIQLGSPQNSYYLVQGTHVYSRDFSKIKVLVNPTNQSYQVSLSGQYETLDGQPVTSPITVNPHTGILLKKLGDVNPPSNVLIKSGFETGDFTEWDGTYVTAGETASVVQTLPHEGIYHAKFTTDDSAAIARAYCYKNVTGTSELYALAYVNVDSGLPLSSWNALWLIQFRDASGSVIASYGVKADATGTKWALMYGSQTAYASSGPVANTWYSVEAYFNKTASGKTLTIYVDSQEAASLTVNTSGAPDIAQVRVGIAYNDPGYAFNIYIDSVMVYNGAAN